MPSAPVRPAPHGSLRHRRPGRHPQPRTTRASPRSAEVLPPPAGDTRRVARRLVASGSPSEKTIGFSRAVRDGRHVLVAGTCAVMPDGSDPPGDAYGQARRCLEIIVAALAETGATQEHVVRTRTFQ